MSSQIGLAGSKADVCRDLGKRAKATKSVIFTFSFVLWEQCNNYAIMLVVAYAKTSPSSLPLWEIQNLNIAFQKRMDTF